MQLAVEGVADLLFQSEVEVEEPRLPTWFAHVEHSSTLISVRWTGDEIDANLPRTSALFRHIPVARTRN